MPHSACNEHGSSSASPFEQLLLCSTSSSSSNAAGFLLLVSRRHEHRRLAVQRQVNERRLLQPGLSINLAKGMQDTAVLMASYASSTLV
eukprot:1158238-Pleurochrysis_carterae.AAC.2